MTDLTENGIWEVGIYQIETSDPVLGGPPDLPGGFGIANVQAQQLGNRTVYLKGVLESADPLAQYFNQARGDVRYYTKTSADGRFYTQAQVNQKFTDLDSEADPFDQYFNQTRGDARYYTKAGTDDRFYTRSQVDALIADQLDGLLSVGSILAYAGATAPSGFFICDGSSFTGMPKLTEILGSSTLPDLRGMFIRGLDKGRSIDGGRVLGSYQSDATRRVTANIYIATTEHGGQQAAADGAAYHNGKGWSSTTSRWSSNTQKGDRITFDNARKVPTANEVRPHNVALNYVIRHDYI